MPLYGTHAQANEVIDQQIKRWLCLQRKGSGGGKPAVVSALLRRPYFQIFKRRILADPLSFNLAWDVAKRESEDFDGLAIAADKEATAALRNIGEQLGYISSVRERFAANGVHITSIGACRVWYALTRDAESVEAMIAPPLSHAELPSLEKHYSFKGTDGTTKTVLAQEYAPHHLIIKSATFPIPADKTIKIAPAPNGKWRGIIANKDLPAAACITHALAMIARALASASRQAE